MNRKQTSKTRKSLLISHDVSLQDIVLKNHSHFKDENIKVSDLINTCESDEKSDDQNNDPFKRYKCRRVGSFETADG